MSRFDADALEQDRDSILAESLESPDFAQHLLFADDSIVPSSSSRQGDPFGHPSTSTGRTQVGSLSAAMTARMPDRYRMVEAAGSSKTGLEIENLHMQRIVEAGIMPIVRLPLDGEREYRRRLRKGLPLFTDEDIPITEIEVGRDEDMDTIIEDVMERDKARKHYAEDPNAAQPPMKQLRLVRGRKRKRKKN